MLKQSYNIEYTLLFQNYFYINPNILENDYFDLTATQALPHPLFYPSSKMDPILKPIFSMFLMIFCLQKTIYFFSTSGSSKANLTVWRLL